MATSLIKFTGERVCRLGSIPLMKTVCTQIWEATQTLLRNMLKYPEACQTVCKAITGKNYTDFAKALAITHNKQVHSDSDIITYILLGVCIIQGALLIGFFIKIQKDNHTRRERRARAAESIRKKLGPDPQEGLLPGVVEESLTKHKVIPRGKRLSFRYLSKGQLGQYGRTRECEETHGTESSAL